MHYLLNHLWAFILVTASVSMTSGAIGGMLFSLLIDPHASVVAATGTWAIGIIGAISTWYYFQVDHKRDISVHFTSKRIDCKTASDKTFSKLVFCLQAYNDSRIGNVVSAQRIYITTKMPSYSAVSNDYSKGKDKLPFIKIDSSLVSENLQDYYSVQPYGITPELIMEQENFKAQISHKLPILYNNEKHDKCCLSFVFSDVKDDPYIFQRYFKL